jgi:5,10-methylenetetrahydromethanopterin reductase
MTPEHRAVPRLACALPPSRDFPAHARLAEELGYARVWAFDSPALYGDVWVALARAADATDRIGLATGVTVPFSRHPLVTASAIATVAELAPGRVACALGTGFSAAAALGRKPMTWAALTLYIQQLRTLLAGGTAQIDGAQCRMIHSPGFAPARPIEAELYLAPMGPKGMAAARDHADGVLLTTPADAPRWPMTGLLISGTVLDPGEDHDSPRVIDALGPQYATGIHALWQWSPDLIKEIPGGPQWLDALNQVPPGQQHLAVHEGHLVTVTPRDEVLVREAKTRLTTGYAWTGTADAIRHRAQDTVGLGITELVYNPSGTDIPGELQRFAQAVNGSASE